MKCPFCGTDQQSIVIRTINDTDKIRRRRACLKCGKRYYAVERAEANSDDSWKEITLKLFNRCFAANGSGIMCHHCEYWEICDKTRTIDKAEVKRYEAD